MLNIWLSNMDSALSHLSEYGICNTLFSSSRPGDDISQIACALEMLPVAAEMGREAWQPMEIQRAYPIKHAASFITLRTAGWMSFNITMKHLFWLSRRFVTGCDTSAQIWRRKQQTRVTDYKTRAGEEEMRTFSLSLSLRLFFFQPRWRYLHLAARHTICICYQSKNLPWKFNEQRG